jgi:O-antigen/teichoic acid export membrane protein
MLFPILGRLHSAGNRARVEEAFYFGTKVATCISVFICFAIVAWGKAFIIRWMGSPYLDGYLPMVVLALAAFLDACQKPSIDFLYATFNNRIHTYLNSAEGLLNLLFSLALARPLGILGVALGTLIGACVVRITVQPWWVCKVTGLPYTDYLMFLVKTVLRCGGLAAAAIAIVAWGITPNYFWLVTSAISSTALYGIGSWWIVLDGPEREKLFSAIKRGARQTTNPALSRAAV